MCVCVCVCVCVYARRVCFLFGFFLYDNLHIYMELTGNST